MKHLFSFLDDIGFLVIFNIILLIVVMTYQELIMNFGNTKLVKNCGVIFDAVGTTFSAVGDAAGYLSDASREARIKQRLSQKLNLKLHLEQSKKDTVLGLAACREELAEYAADKQRAKYLSEAEARFVELDAELAAIEAELDL